MEKYNHRETEKKWQKSWKDSGIYKTQNKQKNKENFYILVEFPYPSGNLHVGHWYAYSVPDIYARFMRMNDKNVLFPIGFDAFGLPAENAAIKNSLNPKDWTEKNIDYMKNQIESMGASYDWSREVVTSREDYYKWTQWLFIQLFNAGLVVYDKTRANWCASCKTVLANEQVIDNKCERCDTEIEKKEMPQWKIKITDYADRLIDDLDDLDWPEEIKTSQKNWIGRSEGAEIEFKIKNSEQKLTVFTTRPDTLFGVTYMVLAPEHNIINSLKEKIKNWQEVSDYIKSAAKKSEIERLAEGKEKTGVKLEGVFAINPVNNEEVPVFVADYVLADYGSGAIMAVPAHDERDFEFAKKFNLSIRQVVVPCHISKDNPPKEGLEEIKRDTVVVFLKDKSTGKFALLNWHGTLEGVTTSVMGGIELDQTPEEAASAEIREETAVPNAKLIKKLDVRLDGKYCASHKNQNRLAMYQTFLFEVENLDKQDEIDEREKKIHTLAWISEDEVENALTTHDHKFLWKQLRKQFAITGSGRLINSGKFNGEDSLEVREEIVKTAGGRITKTYKLRDWGVSRQRYWGCPIPIIQCSDCGFVAESDENLPVKLPEIKDYLPNDDGRSPLSKSDEFVSAICPKCGQNAKRETDTLDTFVDSSWYFLRYCDPKNDLEFASSEKLDDFMPVDFYSGGAEHTTMHLLYSRFFHKALFDLGLVNEKEPYKARMNRGLILGPDGNKMSKSKGNVIDPDDIVRNLGADTMRIYLAFIGPYNKVGAYPWNPESIIGVRRFIERIWKLQSVLVEKENKKLDIELQKTLKQVTDSLSQIKMNTGVASMMSLLNFVEKEKELSKVQFELFLKMLAPFAPHISEELWFLLGHKNSIHLEKFPEVDSSLLKEENIEMVIQVNGKLRDRIVIEIGKTDEELKELALSSQKVQNYIGNKSIKKVIVVKGRVVNLVV